MRMSIVGLGLAGKTTFFNLLTQRGVAASLSGKKGGGLGTVFIPDPRLEQLTAVYKPKKQVHAAIEFMDSQSLQAGQQGGGFDPGTLEDVRKGDTLALVVREFESPLAPHPSGKVDGARDLANILTEFIFNDLALIEKRLGKLKKTFLLTHKREDEMDIHLLEKCNAHLEAEKPLTSLEFTPQELKSVAGFQFLTLKPLLVVLNIGEGQIGELDTLVASYSARFPGLKFTALCATFETELAQMAPADAAEFMKDMGLHEPAFNRILQACLDLLGLQLFFTAGEDECRSWTVAKHATAFDAAGAIHTDFQKGFIRALVLPYAKFAAAPSPDTFKTQHEQQRREYIMQDGDIVEFRFSVSK